MREYTISDFNIRALGSIYQPDRTVFRVFAPEYENMELVIRNHAYQMHRNGFVFEIALGGDLELERYHYRNEKGLCFRDPFAYLSDENDSIVLNPDKFLKETIMPEEYRDMINDRDPRPWYEAVKWKDEIDRECQLLNHAGSLLVPPQ